jgi:S1-C subfamily serine protease
MYPRVILSRQSSFGLHAAPQLNNFSFLSRRSLSLIHFFRSKMSSPELSPKHPEVYSKSSGPFSTYSLGLAPFSDEEETDEVTTPPQLGLPAEFNNNGTAASTPVVMETQPTAMDLLQDQDFILDPSTPSTPKHRHAEKQMLQGPAAQVLKRHMDAVVKVFTTHTKPNFELPWQSQQQTGFAVTWNGERHILTNAHSVTYGSQVQLKRRGDDERFQARVLAVGTECDVALLDVDDEEFWKDISPLELSSTLPELQQSLCVLGFPIGGDSLAISAGVVSRVGMTMYSFGCTSLLAVQTDAAINSGNSGGPVLNTEGRCVGLAFQALTGDAQSIGYVIPTSVVRHFLQDVHRNGKFTGFPALNINWQELDSKALKKAYGLGPHQKGVLVRKVVKASNEASCLQKDDVILKIGGCSVGGDGTVPFRHGERVDFKFIITNRFVGDDVDLEILRNGEKKTVSVTLQPYQHLVPPHNAEEKPSYFMFGGLVFTACSDPYLVQRYGSLGNSPVRLMAKTFYGTKEAKDEQVVVLSNILACPATVGYDSTLGLKDSAVLALNGEKIKCLAHLARLITACKEQFLRFDMEAGGKVIVVETEVAKKCTADVMEQHNMNSPMSKDVRLALNEVEEE